MRISVLALIAVLAVPVCAGAQPVTYRLDCATGRRIDDILRIAPAGHPLIVELRGTCVQNVHVTRPDVTLRGNDRAADGVRAPSDEPGSAAVEVLQVRNVSIEKLTLSGGHVGVSVTHTAEVRVSGAHLTGNRSLGVEVRTGGQAQIEDTAIDGNAFGAVVVDGAASRLRCRRCTVISPRDPHGESTEAVYVSGQFFAMNCTIEGPLALQVSGPTGEAGLTDTDVTGHVYVSNGGSAGLGGGVLNGPLGATYGGRLSLAGVVQTAGPANLLSDGSYLTMERYRGAATVLPRTVQLDRFSHAAFHDGTVDSLVCQTGSDASCSGTTVGRSSCGLCPAP
jgi:hypothetical protein